MTCACVLIVGLAFAVPPPAQAAGTGGISGAVTDAGSSAALGDISVTAYQWDGDTDSWKEMGEATTSGDDGSYEIVDLPEGENYRVAFRDPSETYATVYYGGEAGGVACVELAADLGVDADATTSGIDIGLDEAGQISGTVTDAEGGVGDIVVTVFLSVGDEDWVWVSDTTTSAGDGSYEIGGLPAGSYQVSFGDWEDGDYVAECYNNKPSFDEADDVVVIAGENTPGIDAVLAKAGHIEGTVADAKGAGVPNIAVRAYASREDLEDGYAAAEAQTDTDGTYDLGGLPEGSYFIEFLDDAEGDYVTQYYDGASSIDEAAKVDVTAGATKPDIDATLEAAGHVTGMVTAEGGGGLADIDVTALRADDSGGWDWITDVNTDVDGGYDLGGLAEGEYVIWFVDESGRYATQYYDGASAIDDADPVTVTAGETMEGIDAVLLGGGHITGAVTDEEDGALSGVWVAAYQSDGDGGWECVDDTSTNAIDGGYDLGGLAEGDYRVEFGDRSGDYVSEYYDDKPSLEEADDVPVTAGETTPGIDAELAKAGHISGTVTDEEDKALGGISVVAYRSDGDGGWEYANDTSTNADDDGSYDLGGLAEGDYRVEFGDRSGDYVSEYYDDKPSLEEADDVPVTAGETTPGIDAELAKAGHIAGTVTDEEDKALGGISVTAYRSDGEDGWEYVNDASTNATDGSYDLGGLAESAYRVEFRDRSGDYITEYYDDKPSLDEADDVPVTAGETASGIDAALAEAGHIAGTVTDEEDKALGGISVTAYRSDGEDGWEYVNDASTNATDGSYDLGGLAESAYRVEFRDRSGDYITEYYDDKPSLDEADDVAVNGGETASGIDAELAKAARVRGTVTRSADGPLGGISVVAYRSDGSGGWEYVSDTSTNAGSGDYEVKGLAEGSYCIEFNDRSGVYAREYYDDKASQGLADPLLLSPGEVKSGIDAELAEAGHIVGSVTNEEDKAVGGVWVTAYQSDGSGGWEYVNDTSTDATFGGYEIGSLPAGSYRVEFRDDSRTYVTEYYDDKSSLDEADDVEVTAGETASDIDAVLGPDDLAPTTTADLSPSANAAGWRNAPVTVTLSATDAGFGVDKSYYRLGGTGSYSVYDAADKPVISTNGTTEVWYYSTDLVGNAETPQSVTVRIDASIPTVTDNAPSGWSKAAVTVTLTPVDTGGSGIEKTRYRLSGSTKWLDATGDAFTVTAPADGSNDGAHTYDYQAVDVAGNASVNGSCIVRIDASAPSTSTLSSAPSGWSKTPVTVTLLVSDPVSGVAKTEYRLQGGSWTGCVGSFVASAEGAATYEYRSVDLAGNEEAARTFATRIDTRAPATKAFAASVRKGKKVKLAYRVSDALPGCGEATATLKIFKGKKLKKTIRIPGSIACNTAQSYRWRCTLAKGKYTIKVYATDMAGNAQSTVGTAKLKVR